MEHQVCIDQFHGIDGLEQSRDRASGDQGQGLTVPQPDATNYPPARRRTPGDIMSEYRATSSRNARATSSESARPGRSASKFRLTCLHSPNPTAIQIATGVFGGGLALAVIFVASQLVVELLEFIAGR